MKFKLKTAGSYYHPKEVSKLTELGFKFTADRMGIPWMIDDDTLTIEIGTLEKLVDFAKTHKAIIIEGDTITIYDDYIE